MEHLVSYNITAIDRITPVYSRLIAMSQKLSGNNAAIKSTTEGVGASVNKLTESAVKTQGVINTNAAKIANSAAGITKLNQAYERMSSMGVQRFGRVKKSASETNAEIARQLPIIDRLKNKLTSYERKALGVGNSIKKGFGSVVNYLGPVGATIGGVFAFSQMKQGFDVLTTAASNLNESTNKAKVVFGNNFAQIDKFSNTSAKALGISKQQALETTATFGTMFKGMGMDVNESTKLSQFITTLSSDVASINNLTTEDAIGAMMSGIRGEMEPLTRIGVVLNDATIKEKAFSMGLIKSTKEAMTPAIKTRAILAAIIERTTDAQGDRARTINDEASQTRTLIAMQADLQAKIGSGLLPIKLALVNTMIKSVEWISKNSERLISWGKTAIWVGGTLLGLYGAARTILFARHYYLTVAKALMIMRKSTLLTAVAQKALALGQTLSMLATNGVARSLVIAKLRMIAFNVVARLSPFGWIALAITGIVLLIKHWDKVKVWLSKFWDWFKNIMSKVASWVVNNHPMMWMVNIIDKVFPGFKQKLTEAFDWIKDAFGKLGQWIFDKVIGPIGRFFKAAATEYSKDFQPKVKQPQFAKPFQFDAVARVQTDKNFTGVTSFLYPGQKSSKNNQENIYDGTLKDLYAGGSNPPGDNSKDKTSTVGDSVSGLVQAGGKEVKNITIRIENLVKQMDFNVSKTIRETSGQMKEEVVKALLTAVNDVNYQ
jgi:hypothetical protein